MLRSNNLFGVKNFFEMSRRFTCLHLLLLQIVLMVSACVDDPKFDVASLEGRWEITRGLRNGQETGTLTGTYFRFGTDGKMITNLPVGPEIPIDFEIVKSSILQKSASPVEYAIRSLDSRSMVLAFELRGMQFEIYLQKQDEKEPVPELQIQEQNTSDTVPPVSSEG